MPPKPCSLSTLLALSLLLGLPAVRGIADAAEPFILSFDGIHYECALDGTADPSPGTLLAIGDSYAFVGEVTGVSDILLSQFAPQSNQYTVVILGGTVSARQVTASGDILVLMAGPISLQVFEDPHPGGTAIDYAPSPPNAQVPSTFTDGLLVLEASLSNFAMQWVPSERRGAWSADTQLSGGAWLSLVGNKDYRVGGNHYPAEVPSGYHARSQSEWVAPVDVQSASWGKLKSLYR